MTPFEDLTDNLISVKATEAMKSGEKAESDSENSSNDSSEILSFFADKSTQYLAAGLGTIGAFSAGTFLSWTSSALPLLRNDPDLKINRTEETWIACLLALGAFVGAIPTGLIAERFGRRKTLLSLSLPIFVSWSLIASRTSIYCIYVGRFVGGIAVGALSVAIPPYIAEISQPGVRGVLAQYSQIQFAFGILLGYGVGVTENLTVISLVLLAIPLVLYLVGFIIMPESPIYLLSQQKDEEAKNSLTYLRGVGCDIEAEIKNMQNYITESISKGGEFKDLFANHSNVKALIIASILMMLQQMTGITTIVFFLGPILEKADVKPFLTIVIGTIHLLSTVLSINYVGRAPRRSTMIFSNLVMAVTISALGLYFHLRAVDMIDAMWWVPVSCLSFFICFYSIGFGPIPWLMLRELFPTNIQRRATAISAGINWFMAFVTTAMFNTMVDSVQIGWVMCCYGTVCLLAALFVYKFVPETKGKSVKEIHGEFSKRGHSHVCVIVKS